MSLHDRILSYYKQHPTNTVDQCFEELGLGASKSHWAEVKRLADAGKVPKSWHKLRRVKPRMLILDYLSKHPDGVKLPQIQEATGLNYETISTHLSQLFDDELIDKDKHTFYYGIRTHKQAS